jgi:hypothetical protein
MNHVCDAIRRLELGTRSSRFQCLGAAEEGSLVGQGGGLLGHGRLTEVQLLIVRVWQTKETVVAGRLGKQRGVCVHFHYL